MKQVITGLLLLVVMLMSCKKSAQVVRVRFENQTMWNFTNIYANEHKVGDLSIGATTGYTEYSE